MSLGKVAIRALAGVVTFGAGVYAAVAYASPNKRPQTDIQHDEHLGGYISLEQSKKVHDHLAPKYDKLIDVDETVAGVHKMREVLGNASRGSVLEVAVGSGRNFLYYGPAVTRITAIDYSHEMMKQALAKAKCVPVQFIEGDVHTLSQLLPDQKFDTIVDTFGLCSFENPVKVLQEMQKVCKSDGQILLLEHGRSSSGWMRAWMDRRALSHASNWACFYNRDIEKLVQESGLIVDHLERRHLGTTYYIVARPGPEYTGVPTIDTSSSVSTTQTDAGSGKLRQAIKEKVQNIANKL